MGIRFSADDVFEIAIQIEDNGAAFYRKAANIQPDAKNRSFLNGLAAMEEDHKKTFVGMRASLIGGVEEMLSFDPDGEASLYLQAISGSHGGEGSPSAAQSLTGKETMKDIVLIAMGLENKSILYYVGLKDMVKSKEGKTAIETIISEEQGHIVQLNRILSGLS